MRSRSRDQDHRPASPAWLPLVLLVLVTVFFGLGYVVDALSLPRWGEALLQGVVAAAGASLVYRFWRRGRS